MTPQPSTPTPTAHEAEVVVRLGGTTLDVRHLRPRGRFRIGEGHRVDLPLSIDGLDADGAATLVHVRDDGVALRLFAGLAGELDQDDALVDLQELRARGERTCLLRPGAHAVLCRGPLTIEISVRAAEAAPILERDRVVIDRGHWWAQGASLALLGTLFVILAHVEPAPVDLERDYEVERRRIVVALTEAAPPAAPPTSESPTPAPTTQPATPTPIVRPPTPQLPAGPRLVDTRGADDDALAPAPRLSPSYPQVRRDGAVTSQQGALLGDAAKEWIAEVETRSRERYRDTREDADAWSALTSGSPDMSQGTGSLTLKAVLVDKTASGAVGITDREIAESFMAQRAKARRRPRDDGFRERPVLASARAEGRTVASTSSFAFGVSGAPTVIGSLDQAHAGEVVKHHRPHLATCWADARRRDPDLKARLTVAVTVNPRGRVKRVELPGQVGDPELGRCLAMSIREWRYDAPPDGEPSVITYTLSFGGA